MVETMVKDGIIRIALVMRNEYAVLRAELIKGGEFTTIAIDRYKNATKKNISDLRREGIRIARTKRVKFVDEIALAAMKETTDVKGTKDAVLAHNHACVRP